ncbi:hypothetical protein EXIGLDRAFT_749469 [Exidia glandulosa HHB12029]|uniref:Uncharacterized protein n=1 Tax=Exidia glandulosa HHB12029 TaxID=1314781 RepID=A0A165I2U6_EXIGL|nr:hypothetical protein EXIGLDRAFT_749469 [Exidia glandulosa HHB12029]
MHSHSHCSTSSPTRLQTQEIAHILDPYYHIDPSKCSPASPCPSMLSFRSSDTSTTWTDATGKHDPDFRPFESSHRRMSFQSQHSPRSSFDLAPHSPSSPSKAARNAARRELHPDFRRAIKAHERDLAKERCEERKPSWLKRRRTKSQDALETESALDDEEDVEDLSAYSPPPLPELVLDEGSDDENENDENDADEKRSSHSAHLRRQFASLSLRVDLAVFRAKKHLRGRLGLD